MCCSVNGYVCVACLTMFVNGLVKQFEICLDVVVILLLNVMEVFSGGGGALLDRPCMVFKECACRVCDPHVLFMLEVISSFKSLRDGSQDFVFLMLFLCVILHVMWSGKSLRLLCILPFGMLCLSAFSMMFF